MKASAVYRQLAMRSGVSNATLDFIWDSFDPDLYAWSVWE